MDRCKNIQSICHQVTPDHPEPAEVVLPGVLTTESCGLVSSAQTARVAKIEDHALKHFEETRHPLAMEVRDLYVFCYLCKDYVLNDNPEGDLEAAGEALLEVRGQTQDPPLEARADAAVHG